MDVIKHPKWGDIENIPVSSNVADVIISNCVLNLVPDKNKDFEKLFERKGTQRF